MLLYASDHTITIDELREIVWDTGTPLFTDAQYQTWIDRYPDDWRMAAYTAADQVYGQVAFRPNRISSEGDSISWTDARITALRDKRDALKADIDADGFGEVVTYTAAYLTDACLTEDCLAEGESEWS